MIKPTAIIDTTNLQRSRRPLRRIELLLCLLAVASACSSSVQSVAQEPVSPASSQASQGTSATLGSPSPLAQPSSLWQRTPSGSLGKPEPWLRPAPTLPQTTLPQTTPAQPTTNQPATNQPTATQPTATQPSATQPTTATPPAATPTIVYGNAPLLPKGRTPKAANVYSMPTNQALHPSDGQAFMQAREPMLLQISGPQTVAEMAIPNFQVPATPASPMPTGDSQSGDALHLVERQLESLDLLGEDDDDDDLLLGPDERNAPRSTPMPEQHAEPIARPEALGGDAIPLYSNDAFLNDSRRSPAASALDALPPSLLVDPRDGSASADAAKTPGNDSSAAKSGVSFKTPKYDGPSYDTAYGHVQGPQSDVLTRQVPYQPELFSAPRGPIAPFSPYDESSAYRGKLPVATQRPLLELGRPLYTGGLYPEAKTWLGKYNPIMPHFMVYGDFRTGFGSNDLGNNTVNALANRANLDMDLEITATERLHGFIGPLDRGGEFTHFDLDNGFDFVDRSDLRVDTLFFEGDAGAIWGGLSGQDAPFDLPFTFGLLPFFYQNGIWANDAAMGAAVALPWRNSPLLKWSNFDATFFWASDQINSDAFPGDNNAAEFFGTAWFIEAYDGYFEINYAFVHDDVISERSYHNFSASFAKRYFYKVSNAVRFITNFGQDLPRAERTAQGHLLLLENSLISSNPNFFVPYFNVFYGQGRTQSLARAGVAGGILNNTGINFETDGLTGYPTLDATGVNTTGAALGVNMLGPNFNQQLIMEVAALAANGASPFRNAAGDQYAVGMRYQRPLTNAWIFRTDHMYGWRRGEEDLRGTRMELRMKF